MFERVKRRTRIHYNAEGLRKTAIRIGVAMIVMLVLLCYIEIRKEAIAAGWYEKTLYKATAAGRWLKYGQYEPTTLYQKILDKVPVLHYTRVSALRAEAGEAKSQQQMQNRKENGESNGIGRKTDIENTDVIWKENNTAQGEINSEEQGKSGQEQGSLLVRYAYGNIQSLQEESAGPQGGQEEANAGSQGQIQQAEPWAVANASRRSVATIMSTVKEQYRWTESAEQARFLKNYYIADVSVGNVNSVINGERFLTIDTSLECIREEPQILIYHTHGTEGYSDSRKGVEADTVVGMGDILCEELTARGFSVIHDRTTYDYVNGKDNRNYAYTTARPQIEALLEEYPSIEVVLDIHRDSGAARRTTIGGKDTAQIMLFNGLCRNADGPISYLENPYLEETLAFSLQLNLLGRERYPGLMYKLYLKNYRYNMHFTGHCMLVELGTQNNTVEEAQNGVRYLAELLHELLTE